MQQSRSGHCQIRALSTSGQNSNGYPIQGFMTSTRGSVIMEEEFTELAALENPRKPLTRPCVHPSIEILVLPSYRVRLAYLRRHMTGAAFQDLVCNPPSRTRPEQETGN
jgi:hypothetical protein